MSERRPMDDAARERLRKADEERRKRGVYERPGQPVKLRAWHYALIANLLSGECSTLADAARAAGRSPSMLYTLRKRYPRTWSLIVQETYARMRERVFTVLRWLYGEERVKEWQRGTT